MHSRNESRTQSYNQSQVLKDRWKSCLSQRKAKPPPLFSKRLKSAPCLRPKWGVHLPTSPSSCLHSSILDGEGTALFPWSRGLNDIGVLNTGSDRWKLPEIFIKPKRDFVFTKQEREQNRNKSVFWYFLGLAAPRFGLQLSSRPKLPTRFSFGEGMVLGLLPVKRKMS